MKRSVKLIKGQNLRYIGRPFPGYSSNAPYMTFVDDHNVYEITVMYNHTEMIINRFSVKALS
ncbi:hypothetical protein [Mucilaginibacter paludis]|uniref:Uncharacterized protein n=1 Tax=Mucilaginibacter paludis DSM 18603 TaxID=714943 RepID=H1Y5F1_9SPHI|nr:hypothetical protein [Mucilaginibacter paludis]EHQ28962.1 hypothetical protein Mucpa_4878 [Mucilaginibacter paludis DSM 18603]